ncbi:MAG: hypothetical protein IJF92_02495 [Bacilli bacterium]|nr:hypothetical protein [Bacilli bacterium]
MSEDYFKKDIEETFGMPYDEFIKLDTKEQHHLIEKTRGKKFKIDERARMDGVPISNITLDEKIQNMEDRMLSKPKKLVKIITNKFSKK